MMIELEGITKSFGSLQVLKEKIIDTCLVAPNHDFTH